VEQCYPFEALPLPYPYDGLAPYLNAETLTFHHDKHYQAYVEGLNQILEKCPQYQSWSLNRLVTEYAHLPRSIQEPVRNNAGGVYNHGLYFMGLCPGGSMPGSRLTAVIEKAFGSFQNLNDALIQCAMSQFGSGYAFLISDAWGRLGLVKAPNQQVPLSSRMCPLLAIDVWEHAYYLQYQNRRKDYLTALTQVIDWSFVEHRYADVMDATRRRGQRG